MIKAGFLFAMAALSQASNYCWKDRYVQTDFRPLSCRPGTDHRGDKCYEPCNPGYSSDGRNCIANCNQDYGANGMLCIRHHDSYWKGCCCTIFTRHCCGNCRGGYNDWPCHCDRPYHVYVRGVYAFRETPKTCNAPYSENIGGQCYQPCKSGYQAVNKECWSKCPSGFQNCGNACGKSNADCADKVIEAATKGNANTLAILNTITDPTYFKIAQKATRMHAVRKVNKRVAEALEKYIRTIRSTAKRLHKRLSSHSAKDLAEYSLAQAYEALYDKKLKAAEQVDKAWSVLSSADPKGELTVGKAFAHPMCAEMKNGDASGETYHTKKEHGHKRHGHGHGHGHKKHGHGRKHKKHHKHGHKHHKHGHKHGHKHHGKHHQHRNYVWEQCDAQLPEQNTTSQQ